MGTRNEHRDEGEPCLQAFRIGYIPGRLAMDWAGGSAVVDDAKRPGKQRHFTAEGFQTRLDGDWLIQGGRVVEGVA